MVVRRTTYPQVEPRAADLMTRAIAVVPRALAVADAARLADERRARLLLARLGARWAGVTPATLARALALGLARVPVATLLWDAPAVAAATPEIALRRRLGPATPFAVVLEAGRPAGAVFAEPAGARALARSAAEALGRVDAPTRELLRAAAAAGAEGEPVAAVGGFARDLLHRGPAAATPDLDLAVEGDGRRLARRLAEALGGRVTEHGAFLTATIALPDGRRVDVATARRERYDRPGALPHVETATLGEDLARRDFSVNALAVRVDGAAWGDVLDPAGGLAELRRGVIRVLHPLSFVEDPTRIFRAARFAVRLGFRLNGTTRRLATAAAGLAVYEALSGERLRTEIHAALREAAPAAVLGRLGRLGAFRLLAPGWRFAPPAARLVERVGHRAAGLPLSPETVEALYLLALTAGLPPAAAEAWTARLGVPEPTRRALGRAHADAPGLLARLQRAAGPAEAYAMLRGVPELVAAWAAVLARRAPARRYLGEHLRGWRGLRPLLSGADLQAMGLAPGPLFGRLLEGLLAAQAAGRLTTREQAARWVRRAVAMAGARRARVSTGAPSAETNGS